MSPIVMETLPLLDLAHKLSELGSFLSNRGLVAGWNVLPVTIEGHRTTWNELLHV